MKRFLVLLLFIITFLPIPVSAHSVGYPPFFKINGQLPDTNLLTLVFVNPNVFPIPQDTFAENFSTNQDISFEIDGAVLKQVIPEQGFRNARFYWDFGDGTKAEGLKNTHKYSDPGSYIPTVYVDFQQPNIPPQLIESVQLNILPYKNYRAPTAIIYANGKKVTDPKFDYLDIDLDNKLNLDAGDSQATSVEIVEYLWNFNDGTFSNKKVASHQYKLPLDYVTVSLREKDSNGLMTYSFIGIRNSGKNTPNNITPQNDIEPTSAKSVSSFPSVVLLIVSPTILVLILVKWRKKILKLIKSCTHKPVD